MKVEFKVINKVFTDLVPGDVFVASNEVTCMKVRAPTGMKSNAVEIESGTVVTIHPDKKVRHLPSAKVVIE